MEFKYPPTNVHWTFLMATWIWLWPLTDILQKGLLSDGDPRMLLLQWGWVSLGFCSIFSDNFFVVTYTCLSLVLTIDFCYSQLTFFCNLFKKTQNKISKKKTIKYSEKKWIHSRRVRGGPTFKLRRLSWGPTFKLWRGAEGPGSWGPGPTFTPCLGCSKFYVRWSLCYVITIAQKVLCILLVLCISNVCLNSPKLIAIQSNWKKRRYFSCYTR